MLVHVHVQQIVLLVGIIFATEAASQSRPGCPDSCGSLKIPFPFGTREGCYLDEWFLINCSTTASGSARPFLRKGNITVLSISLNGELRVRSPVARDCYNESGNRFNVTNSRIALARNPISSTRNRFTAIGCDTFALIRGVRGQNYTTGCISLCDRVASMVNGSCSGIGCCQTMIPEGARDFAVRISSFSNHSSVQSFNPCSYGFVVEEGAYEFSSTHVKDFQQTYGRNLPVVLDWAAGNTTCQEAQNNLTSYACQAANSECYDSTSAVGYRCNCSSGYEGNPYLADGCKDIDECAISKPCNATCLNLPGSFSCSCPEGYEGDGLIDGIGCRPIAKNSDGSHRLLIPLCISLGLLVLLVASSWIYWGKKKRKLMKLKVKFFEQNGGLILQQQLSNHRGTIDTARIFSAEELKKATNNFEESRVLGQGGYGTVYKGVLADNKVVAIKKSKIVDQSQIEQFINEVIVLSQINHRNVVKLLGCCLETEVPLLVYEFITNGTLSDHIHDKANSTSLPWEMRLKIAAETAGALAYLHSSASMPIIHRDVKAANILLDDSYTAKVADFGASRLVPLDQTQLTTLVQGTLGYLDPEYFHTSTLTEKSDVYSFGIVLAELLTGKMAISLDRPEKERNLAMYFVSAMKEEKLVQILDPVVNEGNVEQVKEVAKLVTRCLRVTSEERPTMKEVAAELERLRIVERRTWIQIDSRSEDIEYLLGMPSMRNGDEAGHCSTNVGYDSIRDQILLAPIGDGR